MNSRKNMNRFYQVVVLLLVSLQSFAQEINVNYYPKFDHTVSESDYMRGKEILKNAYDQCEEYDTNYADYWNVAVAFSSMGVDKETILKYLKKSKALNARSFSVIVNCQIEKKRGFENTSFYKLLGQRYVNLISDCKDVLKPKTIKERMMRKAELNLNGLNETLIDRLIVCMDKDQRYRHSGLYSKNKNKQDSLDREVQLEMTEIYNEFGYPGRDLVGESFMNNACLFLEHGGTIEYKEKFFSLVVNAYHKVHVGKGYLKMLIDRIHWLKFNKQIFGSHMDIPFDTPEVVARVKEKYGLD